jgi:predicted nuclease of restriction endonuclease-like (RecB) superfamily
LLVGRRVTRGCTEIEADPSFRQPDTRLRASLAVNAELIGLYWRIGRDVLERQQRDGWGAKVVDRLALDLRAEFPGMRGFSRANLLYMRAFAEAWPDPEFVQRVVGQLPWGQNIELLTKLKEPAARLWYAQATLEHGWSRPVLAHQIGTRLKERQGQAVTNFARTLPPPESDLAQQIIKDPYQFDFLTVAEDAKERDLERALVAGVKDVLLEMGKGFAFVGSQHHLEIGGQDWYVDLGGAVATEPKLHFRASFAPRGSRPRGRYRSRCPKRP